MNGTSGTIFSPDKTMTHAMLLTILHRAAGCPKAVNSGGSTWYSEAVAWSGEEGLTADYDNGYLDPNTPVSRELIAVILWRYGGSPTSSAAEDFEDEDNISAFAQTAVDWARNLGVMDGAGDNRFDPKGTTTRAQTVVVLHRYLSHAGDTSGGGGSIVYMTADISPQGLMEIYEAMNRPAQGENVAVKLSMGEPGGHFADYDFYAVLSHFKGHAMGGFGGAIKISLSASPALQGKCSSTQAGTAPPAGAAAHRMNFWRPWRKRQSL